MPKTEPKTKIRKPRWTYGKTYEHNGEAHTVAEWAYITGIKRSTIQERLATGWTIEKALTTATSGGDKPITACYKNEIQTHSILEWAEITGIPESILNSRYYKRWAPDKIINTPYKPYGKTYEIDHIPNTLTNLAHIHNMNVQTVQYRLSVGATIEEALQKGRRCKRYEVDGVMTTVSEVAERTGISRSTIRNRLERGINTIAELEKGATNYNPGTPKKSRKKS